MRQALPELPVLGAGQELLDEVGEEFDALETAAIPATKSVALGLSASRRPAPEKASDAEAVLAHVHVRVRFLPLAVHPGRLLDEPVGPDPAHVVQDREAKQPMRFGKRPRLGSPELRRQLVHEAIVVPGRIETGRGPRRRRGSFAVV